MPATDQPARLNRRQRRARQAQFVKRTLDGPPREPVCGQAKAATRARARAEVKTTPHVPKGDKAAKRAARELQAATGQPYTVCLAEVRAERAATRPELRQ
ncbi:hypothetical protein [Streptomyces sp. NPDC046978]|uniref:hypothetical protein n=1 Tax=Streptomyces sp. NPDC046978 TaxID=3154704 RepID=UPI0033E21E64